MKKKKKIHFMNIKIYFAFYSNINNCYKNQTSKLFLYKLQVEIIHNHQKQMENERFLQITIQNINVQKTLPLKRKKMYLKINGQNKKLMFTNCGP